jgi:hypothetical protein
MTRIRNGMMVGDHHEGRLWRVFAPPWWRVDLWIGWLLTPRLRGRMVFLVRSNGGFEQIRPLVIEADQTLPNVPGPFAIDPTTPVRPPTFQS